MNIKKIYAETKLQICNCKGGKRYFDSFRNIYVHMTPEEMVRQKTCSIMIDLLGVPREVIKTEDHLIHYGVKEKNGRIDITIKLSDEEGKESPLAVIECKEERISVIAKQVKNQAEEYSRYIGAPYFIVTNGIEMYYYHYNEISNNYEEVEGILTYQDMVDNNYSVVNDVTIFNRLKYEEYYNIKKLKQYEWIDNKIGEDTEEELIPTIINLDDCLLDTYHKLEKIPSNKYEVIIDLGEQYRNYNDASGGGFGSAEYRVIRIRDKETNKEFMIGFTIITTGKMINDPKYGTSDGKSVFIIIKNDGDSDEMMVQINLNKCLIVRGKKSIIVHNALITKKGKSKKGLLEYIYLRNKQLVKGNNVILGTLDCSKPLYMNSEDVAIFIANAIEYSMYRDEYKKI
ncbi:MAG: type I restriction enzyme HsdR N-terminal domain-containing protein [Peptostreptococcaceae bacterium]